MSFSQSQSSNTDRLLAELNNKTKTTNKELCCIKDALAPSGASKDYETILAKNPTNDELVIITYTYDSTGLLVITKTNLDGTPYVGPDPVKVYDDFELSTKEWFCVNNTDSISRVDIFIDGTLTSSIWQDISGTIIATPTIGTYTIGECKPTFTLDTVNPTEFATFPISQPILENYVTVDAERSYKDVVRIISDSNDIHRVESINKTTEILEVCYQINFVGTPQKGYLVLIKSHLGDVTDQYIVSNTGSVSQTNALTNANIVDCPNDDYVQFTDLKTEVPCYIQLDSNPITGFSLKENGYLYEHNKYTVSGNTPTVEVFESDNKTLISDNVFIIPCPELQCLFQNGAPFKGYKIDIVSLPSINSGTTLTSLSLYFDENYTPIDDTINPVTVVDCDSNIYNNVNHFLIDDTTHLTINANTAHSIYYNILQGVVNVTIDTTTLPYIQGESGTDIATNLINQEYTFTPRLGGLVKVRVIN